MMGKSHIISRLCQLSALSICRRCEMTVSRDSHLFPVDARGGGGGGKAQALTTFSLAHFVRIFPGYFFFPGYFSNVLNAAALLANSPRRLAKGKKIP